MLISFNPVSLKISAVNMLKSSEEFAVSCWPSLMVKVKLDKFLESVVINVICHG